MGTFAVNDRITDVLAAAAGQTDFGVDFPALKFEGAYAGLFATRVRAGVSATLTVADFDVISPTDAAFIARLRLAALDGDTYQFYGLFPAGRDIAFVAGGAVATETLEDDAAERIVQLQELRRDVGVLQAGFASAGGAEVGAVTSVNGHTGVVVLGAVDVGAALTAHTHAVADVTGLQADLDAKAAVGHAHVVADTTGLQADLDGKSNVGHSHDAADIVSGVLDAARIPALDAAKIATGVFGAALIPALDASKIATGTIDPARLPAGAGVVVASGDMTTLTTPQQTAVVAGTTVVLSDGTQWVYSGSGSKTSTASYTELSITATWASITGKPANTTAFAALVGAADKLAYFTGAGTMALAGLTAYGRSWTAAADKDAASTLLATRTLVNFRDYFAGVGDDATSNDTAFTAAEASAFERIWLPEGTYKTTISTSTLTKRYDGPGKIHTTGGDWLAGFAQLSASPSFGAGSEYGESGDIHFANVDVAVLKAGVRQQLSNAPPQYFQGGASRSFSRYYNRGGASGLTAHLSASAAAGQPTVSLNSVDGITVGQVLGLAQDGNDTILESLTVASVNAGANQVTFTANLAHAYTVYGADYYPGYLSGYPADPRVTAGLRTMNPWALRTLSHAGEGDSYIWAGRVSIDYVPKAGQAHFFETATGGLIGGDMSFAHSGTYGTGWEFQFIDTGNDVSAIGFVNSYVRTNDAGARGVTWIHDFPKSEGSRPIDAFYMPHGAARVGLDLSGADFSSNGQAALQLSHQQRIYFNAKSVNTVGTRARGFYSQDPGNSYMLHDSDGTGEFVDLWVGGNRVIRAKSGGLNVPLPANFGSSLAVATTLSVGQSITVNSGQSIYLNGTSAGGVAIVFDGAHINLIRGGVVVAAF